MKTIFKKAYTANFLKYSVDVVLVVYHREYEI